MKTYITTIEIDECDTKVQIDYTVEFGEVKIDLITDLQTGDAIAPDLMSEMTATILNEELYEWAQNSEQIELENHYRNV